MNGELKSERRTFLNISSFQILIMFRRGLFYSYLSIYLRFFLGLSVTETTLFATIPMIINVICQTFIWGRVSDKLQLRRTLIIIGEVAAAIITIFVWYIHVLPESKYAAGYVMILGMTIIEIFWSMSNVAWSALISDIYPEDQRAGLQGRMASIGAVGRFIGILIGGLLYDGLSRYYDGWGFHSGALFFIASGVMIISAIPMFFVPEGGVKKSARPVSDDISTVPISKIDSRDSTIKTFMIFLLAMTFINFGMNSIILLKSQYLILEDGFNVSSRVLSYILSMGTVAMFSIGLLIKPLSGRFKDEFMLLSGCLIGTLYLVGFILARNLGTVYVSDFLGGTAMVILMSASYSYASKLIPPEKRGKQFALFNASFFLSWGLPGTFITGPLVDGLIKSGASQVYSYKMAFVAAALLVAIGAIVLIFNFQMKKKVTQAEL
ncbi:MAG: MFS transporter [candidate division Zixibacteria bacterium]|nr:MFS transporter [candidate division Zixibacteria bacterium]